MQMYITPNFKDSATLRLWCNRPAALTHDFADMDPTISQKQILISIGNHHIVMSNYDPCRGSNG